MTWAARVAGVVLALIGLVWIGQGLGYLPGQVMSGQSQWAVAGLVLLLLGAVLLWWSTRRRTTV